jgi:hypothetical protein
MKGIDILVEYAKIRGATINFNNKKFLDNITSFKYYFSYSPLEPQDIFNIISRVGRLSEIIEPDAQLKEWYENIAVKQKETP